MSGLKNTNYGYKLLFNEMLSNALGSCPFKIDAFYESVSYEQIMSVHISNNYKISLGINTAFKKNDFFSDSVEMNVAFRAYFIINYIHCLETAKETIPTSFFSGLVVLESVSDLHSGEKITACIPNAFGKNKHLRPIDVYCAIRAMTRVMMEYNTSLSDEAKRKCEKYIDVLVTYTAMPEIEYAGSKYARYTIVKAVNRLKSLILKHSEIVSEYAVFNKIGFSAFEKMSIDEMLQLCDSKGDDFWPAVIVRLLAISKDTQKLKLLIEHQCLKNSCLKINENSFEFYSGMNKQSSLLKDNLQAVQMLVKEIYQPTRLNLPLESGNMHYLQ